MYTYETSKEFLIMSLNKINISVFYPLPSLETPYIVIRSFIYSVFQRSTKVDIELVIRITINTAQNES